MNFFSLLFNKKKAKEFYLGWQNAVMRNSPDHIVMTYAQLKSATIRQVKDDQRIIKDCFDLCERTTKPDTFFSRLNLMVEKANHLEVLEEYADYAGLKTKGFEAVYNSVPRVYNDFIKMFLIRYFSETFDKAEAMKTEKGRINKYQKFYDSLQEYYCCMNSEHIEYVETKHRIYTKH